MEQWLSQYCSELHNYAPHLLVCILVAMVVGWERQRHNPLYTLQMFVPLAVVSCMIVRVSVLFSNGAPLPIMSLAAPMVTGGGIIAAIVLRNEGRLSRHGIITGTQALFTVGMGIVVGLGYFGMAITSTAVLTVLFWSIPLQKKA